MTKLNSNGHKKSNNSIKTEITVKANRRNSKTSKFISQIEAEKTVSESDQLTLRAWKKTFENRNKAA